MMKNIELNDAILDGVTGGMDKTEVTCEDGSLAGVDLDTGARTCETGKVIVTTTSTKGTTTVKTYPSGTVLPAK